MGVSGIHCEICQKVIGEHLCVTSVGIFLCPDCFEEFLRRYRERKLNGYKQRRDR